MTHEKRDPIDMSSEAIDRRLRELGQLYRLWQELKSARRLGPAVLKTVNSIEKREQLPPDR